MFREEKEILVVVHSASVISNEILSKVVDWP